MDDLHIQAMLRAPFLGYARHRLVMDEHGQPAGCTVVDCNEMFVRLTGLSRDSGPHGTPRPIPSDEHGQPGLIARYAQAVLDGGELEFEQCFEATGAWCRVWLFAAESPLFSTLLVDITERHRCEDTVRRMAQHDLLTGLHNRQFAEETLARLEADGNAPLSIISGDINGLKLYNDHLGRPQGDEMLKTVASILRDSCRETDTIARWGGDEFVVILPFTRRQEAEKIVQGIQRACSAARVGDVHLSIALASASRNTVRSKIDTVLRQAESSMYRRKLEQTRGVHSRMLKAFLDVLETKSHETEAHSRRLQSMACAMGRRLGLDDADLNTLSLLAFLHDIGKTGIPGEILQKPGALSDKEWDVMRTHPERGHHIAAVTEEFAHVANLILHHHERWDGQGYGEGLKGDKIPLLSRIIAIVDAYDAMTTPRPYRNSLTHDEALHELQRCAGTQFDPQLVDTFFQEFRARSADACAGERVTDSD